MMTLQTRWAMWMLVALLCACTASPWESSKLSDPHEQAPLSNGMVVSLGSGSFTIASTLLDLAATERWPEAVKVIRASGDPESQSLSSSPVWDEAQVMVHQAGLSASAVGLELTMVVSLQPMSIFAPEDAEKTCPTHVAFDSGVWKLPIRLTRSKLGAVKAAAESYGALSTELVVSDLGGCPEEEDVAPSAEPDYDLLHDDLTVALAEAIAPWLSEEIPKALGLNLAITSPVSPGSKESPKSVQIDIRTSLEDEVTWWHWSEDQLIVGFDMRVVSDLDACVPDSPSPTIPAAPVPSTTGDRIWLLHTGTVNTTLDGVWRNGDLCLDRPDSLSWNADLWRDHWPALSALDEGAELRARLWPSAAPSVTFEDSGTGVEATLEAEAWTVELYGLFQGADVRLATLELDITLSAQLEVGSERALWLVDPTLLITRYEPEGGLLSPPGEDVAHDLVEGWLTAVSGSLPVAWLPPTPQPADVSTQVDGSYLVFTASQ